VSTNHWEVPSYIARQARAADLWMEFTGRKVAAVLELQKEAEAEKTASAEDPAEPPSLGRYAKRGLIAGAALGAGVAGRAAHVSHAAPVWRAALGGAGVGAAAASTLASSYGAGRHVQHVVEAVHRPLPAPVHDGQERDYLEDWKRINPPQEKKAGVWGDLTGKSVREARAHADTMRRAVDREANTLRKMRSWAVPDNDTARHLRDHMHVDQARRVRDAEHLHGQAVRDLNEATERQRNTRRGAAGGVVGLTGAGAIAVAANAHKKEADAVAGSPLARKLIGAAALGLPMAGLGYAVEKNRHTPGPGGLSPQQASVRLDREKLDADIDAGGRPLGGRLRKLYLGLKSDAADEAAEHPRLSGAIGSAVYGGLGALTGAGLGSRILR